MREATDGHEGIVDGLIARIREAADAGVAMQRALENEPTPRGPVAVLAFGKASLAMAKVASAFLGTQLTRIMVVTLPEHEAEARAWVDRDVASKANGAPCTRVGSVAGSVLTGDHPLPTVRSVAAAKGAMEFVGGGEEAEVWVLVSGGGSAMLALPHDGVELEELARLTRVMQEAGATIHDLNTVRRHLDRVKGGQLGARAALGAGLTRRVRAFILSDVIGDALETIASGPTAADPTTPSDALRVIERLGLMGAAKEVAPGWGWGWGGCVAFLERCVRVEGWGEGVRHTVPPGDARLARVENRIIASNALVARAAAAYLGARGIEVVRVEERVEGEAREIGARLAREAAALTPGQAIVMAGEWTVTVDDGKGAREGPVVGPTPIGESRPLGGPSQELALAAACVLDAVGGGRAGGARVLAISTDGRDGPTDAAGAVVDGETCARARAAGVDPHAALARHDSTRALEVAGGGGGSGAGALIRTGATGTNLNHVAVGFAKRT